MQSAGNFGEKLQGILRDHTLGISNIFNFQVRDFSSQNYTNKNFNSYLAGLIEGDGCINIPKNYKDKNNKIISPQITIAFDSRDFPLALLIQKRLNTGQIYKVKGKNAYYYRVSNLINLIKLINIINGYMRTPKISSLYKLIDYVNNRGNLNILKLPLDNSPLDSNAWLSGFIDSDGSFSVRTSEKSKRLACSFELVQRQTNLEDYSYLEVLSKLSIFLMSNLKEHKINTKNPQYRVRTTSLNGNLVLVNYLTKYPLFSKKQLDFIDFNKVIDFFVKKEHNQNFEKIKSIKLSMNDNRTYFNWDHLQNFYIIED